MSVVFDEGEKIVKRRLSIAASTLLVGVTTAVLGGGAPAAAQVVAAEANYSGYSTGAVVHADALTLGTTRVLDTEVAFSGASVASKGLAQIVNEVDQVVTPGAADKRTFGRGSGLELGVGTTVPAGIDANAALLAQRSTALAPPSTDLITNQVGPVKVDPAVYASLLRGQAQARWVDDATCVLGEDLSTGLGYAADAQLLNLGGSSQGNEPFPGPLVATDAPNPERAVSQSKSVTRLVPQTSASGERVGDNFGLMTETRMTIAPVTLLKNTPAPITIEFLGEWVLRSVATGIPGHAYVHYGPGTVNPQTPVLSIIQGTTINRVLSLQDILPDQGLVVEVPLDGSLVSIAVGEDPRAIGGHAGTAPQSGGDGTVAAAAVDVVRVRLLDGAAGAVAGAAGLAALDLRIGHMEAKAQVPAGGIACALPVTKTADKQTVNAGDNFTYNINVTNPFADCDLVNVRVEDNISVTDGVLYSITATNPTANSITPAQVVWNDIGPIGPKQSKTVSINISIPANSASGLFTNNAKATGTCATGGAQGGAKINVPIKGETTVKVPNVLGNVVRGVEVLPRTGANSGPMVLLGLGLLGTALALRRIRSGSLR